MSSVKKLAEQEYCVLCQVWTSTHTNFNCPCLICKWCSKEGHVRRFCPEQVKQEPVDKEAQQHEEDIADQPNEQTKTNTREIL